MNNRGDIYFIAFIILAVIAFFTNPKESAHKEEITNKVFSSLGIGFSNSTNNDTVDGYKKFVNFMVAHKSYLLFSLTTLRIKEHNNMVSFGIFGNVFLMDTDHLTEVLRRIMNNSASRN